MFSHASKLALLEAALARGYVLALYVVALDDPQRLLARIRRRVTEGGHSVPPERVLARYPRTLFNLQPAVRLSSVAYLFEAHEIEAGAHQLIAWCAGEKTTQLANPLPHWAQQVLGD